VDGLWATKSEARVGLIVRALSFQDFQAMWSSIHQRYKWTDRRTDRRTDDMQSQYKKE